jgi:hypothetical protein
MRDRRDPCEGVTQEQLKLFLDHVSTRLKEDCSLDQAIEQVQTMSGSPKVAECVQRRHEERVGDTFSLHEEGWMEEGGFSPWYFDDEKGRFWLSLKAVLENEGWEEGSLDDLAFSAQGIVSRLANPSGSNDKRLGLVVGYVQSGKTTNFTSVIAKAADAGYRLFIVLSGMSNALREQTQARLQTQLVDPNDEAWYRLTVPDTVSDTNVVFTGDFNGDHNANTVLGPHVKETRVLAVVKKNGFRLRALKGWLESAAGPLLSGCPVLIIDDEADQASINTASPDDDPTTINGLIRDIIQLLPKVTYVGYTATPFANVLIDPSHGDDIYPRDFIHSLKKPVGHFGTETLHGREPLDRDAVGDDPGGDGLDMVRRVPDEELDGLKPIGQDIDGFAPVMTPSLRTAIQYFWLATAARRSRSGNRQDSSMLIHTSMRILVHSQFRELVERERLTTREGLRNRDRALEDAFRDLWAAESPRVPARCEGWDNDAVEYEDLRGWLDDVVDETRVIEENGRSADRLNYGTEPQTVIVIGGNTVARGLTLEGLCSSFFVRAAGAYDTLLQMGRWFGFRKGYEDLPRIWMTDELNDWFHHLATVEQEVRYDIERYETEGLTPTEFGPRIRTHPAIAVTAAAKMQHAADAQVSYSGRRIQTILFKHSDPQWLHDNITATRKLVAAAKDYGLEADDSQDGYWIFRDVRAAAILDFLANYRFHEDARDLDSERIRAYIRAQLDNNELGRWSVAILGLTEPNEALGIIDLGLPREVNLINRSRLSTGTEHANIKALMSKVDRMIDFGWTDKRIADVEEGRLASLRNSPVPDDSERKPGEGNDSGLLAVYPISKDSRKQPRSQRLDMEAKDHLIGVGLVFPEAKTDVGRQDYITADLSYMVPREETQADVPIEGAASSDDL